MCWGGRCRIQHAVRARPVRSGGRVRARAGSERRGLGREADDRLVKLPPNHLLVGGYCDKQAQGLCPLSLASKLLPPPCPRPRTRRPTRTPPARRRVRGEVESYTEDSAVFALRTVWGRGRMCVSACGDIYSLRLSICRAWTLDASPHLWDRKGRV